MSDGMPTLAGILGLGDGDAGDAPIARIRESRCFTALASSLPGQSAEYWQVAAGQVTGALARALHTPVSTLLAHGWNHYRPFLRYLDRKAYPPGMVIQETLLRHTIRAALQPRVRVLLDGRGVGDIEFEAAVELVLDGGLLTIQGGRFRELHPGRLTASGTLSCEGAILFQRASADLTLPGIVRFGEGIPICPRAEEAVV